MLRYSAILGVAVAGFLLAFARPCVTLFIPNAGTSQTLAIQGLRLYAFGLIPCCANNALKNCWQGTGRVGLMEVVSVLENALFPVLSAFVLSRLMGVKGAWFLFTMGELLTTAMMLIYIWHERGKVCWGREDLLLLSADLGVPGKDGLEADIRDMDELMTFSRQAEAFCLSHGSPRRLASHLALCVEEMGGNIVSHGFGGGKNHLFVRLQVKEGRWTLRFRDDCAAFDPVSHIAEVEAPGESVGIRLAMRMADEARYTYSMNLNNLTLVLRDS